MAKRISAIKARQALGTLLDDVKLTGAEYLIERDGKPTAAVISSLLAVERRNVPSVY
ncbi:MAG: hypothetical protein WD314_02400 [Trueperaceae bacterium]